MEEENIFHTKCKTTVKIIGNDYCTERDFVDIAEVLKTLFFRDELCLRMLCFTIVKLPKRGF
jgi:hypothetical protein